MRVEITSKVSGGELAAREASKLSTAIQSLEGKLALITIQEKKKERSGQQNRYYWGCVVETILQHLRDCGNYVDADDVHEFLKLRVGKLSRVIVDPSGEVHKSLGSTTKLTTTQFNDYIERIVSWAAEQGIDIPPPNTFNQ